jgi:hypothetical protein
MCWAITFAVITYSVCLRSSGTISPCISTVELELLYCITLVDQKVPDKLQHPSSSSWSRLVSSSSSSSIPRYLLRPLVQHNKTQHNPLCFFGEARHCLVASFRSWLPTVGIDMVEVRHLTPFLQASSFKLEQPYSILRGGRSTTTNTNH